MRKLALLAFCAGVLLALPSIAAAAIPQGAVSGTATLSRAGVAFQFGVTAIDGGTSYVGLENDRSGNCSDDSGTVLVNEAVNFNVVCAHFVASSKCCNAGSPKMRFAYGSGPYNVVKIIDNGIPNPQGQSPDTVMIGTTNSLAAAKLWVNTGAIGSGNAGQWGTSLPLMPDPVGFNSDYTVHA